MKVVDDFPPNIAEIRAAMPQIARYTGLLFCYSDTIYAPGTPRVAPELLAHEKVHSLRQLDEGVEEWWQRYLAEPDFRLVEELLAHRAEYQYLARNGNRQMRRAAAAHVAARLAHPVYGNLIDKGQAKRLIKHEGIRKAEPVQPAQQSHQAPSQGGANSAPQEARA